MNLYVLLSSTFLYNDCCHAGQGGSNLDKVTINFSSLWLYSLICLPACFYVALYIMHLHMKFCFVTVHGLHMRASGNDVVFTCVKCCCPADGQLQQ